VTIEDLGSVDFSGQAKEWQVAWGQNKTVLDAQLASLRPHALPADLPTSSTALNI